MALESFAPALLMGTRYLLSGVVLIAVAWLRGAYLPTGKELLGTAVFGVLTIGVGTGCLVWAEELIPSGLAALFVTLSPFWMVGIEALVPGGARLHGPTIAGMLIGLAGTMLLVAPNAIEHGVGGPVLQGFLLLQIGGGGWSLGSILQRRLQTKAHPVVSGAIQQVATGIVFLIPALVFPHAPVHWSARGAGAILYLVVFGSIIGYSAYIYAMTTLPVSIVTIYNYINPIIALLLGWLIYREAIGWREVEAMIVIFLGVWVVKRFGGKTSAPGAGAEPLASRPATDSRSEASRPESPLRLP
jgi:drug/metabolite transporter (DMT)-like permease